MFKSISKRTFKHDIQNLMKRLRKTQKFSI